MNNRTTPTFGSIIRTSRIAAGLSLQQTADLTDISKSLLRFWEVDHVASPDLAKVMRLASALKLDPMELVATLPGGEELTGALPAVQPYLRSKYPDLPESALTEIADVVRKHGIDPDHSSPAPGEDEYGD